MHGASPIYRGLAPCTSVSWVARENSRALMMKRPAQSLSYVGPIAARHSIMLHLMQDLLHWAQKLALYGLLKLGCVYNFDYMKKLLQILRENRLEKGISQEYCWKTRCFLKYNLSLGVYLISIMRFKRSRKRL